MHMADDNHMWFKEKVHITKNDKIKGWNAEQN